MAIGIDDPPIYDYLTDNDRRYTDAPRYRISDVWGGWISTFADTVSTFLSTGGVFLPKLTSAERDQLKDPSNGQIIYNTESNTFQGYENGAWKTFTLT